MKSIKVFGFTWIAIMGWCLYTFSSDHSENIQLKGKILFSFTPNHFVLQTDSSLYTISKSKLSLMLKTRLEEFSLQNKYISIKLPKKSVEFSWSGRPYKLEEVMANIRCKSTPALVEKASIRNGKLELSGVTALSFSDNYYLVNARKRFYQIKKSLLSQMQNTQFIKAGIGGNVEISLIKNAVEASWSYQQSKLQKYYEPFIDDIRYRNNQLFIKGTLLLSYNEPTLVVQSGNEIFHLIRIKARTANPKSFDNPGSRINLVAPILSVQYHWQIEKDDIAHKRKTTIMVN